MVKPARVAPFDVFENPNRAQREGYPCLVVMQNHPLDHHSARFVMPLPRLQGRQTVLPRRLARTVRVAGEPLHPAAHLSAPLPVHVLRGSTGSLLAQAGVLRDALDAVISRV